MEVIFLTIFCTSFLEKNAYKFERNCKSARFVCFHPWLCRRLNFSLIARYSWKFTRCSLLVVKSPVTRCKICSLRKITRYSLQNSLVTRCRSCSLRKITRYSLQNSLVTRCRSCLLQKITCYSLQNSLVACCRSGVTFCNFMKKKLHHRCFPVNFCETLRTPILSKIKEWLLLKIISKYQQTCYSFLRQVFHFDLI